MPNLIDGFNGSISLADVEDNMSDDEGEDVGSRLLCCCMLYVWELSSVG